MSKPRRGQGRRTMTESSNVTVDRRDGLAVIYTEGYINNQGGEEIARVAYELLDEGYRALLLNLAGTKIVNSIGISILIEIIEKMLEIERQARLLRPHPDHREDLPHHGSRAVRARSIPTSRRGRPDGLLKMAVTVPEPRDLQFELARLAHEAGPGRRALAGLVQLFAVASEGVGRAPRTRDTSGPGPSRAPSWPWTAGRRSARRTAGAAPVGVLQGLNSEPWVKCWTSAVRRSIARRSGGPAAAEAAVQRGEQLGDRQRDGQRAIVTGHL